MSNECTRTKLEEQLRERYGLLLTPKQLAEFLGGLRRGCDGVSPIRSMRARPR